MSTAPLRSWCVVVIRLVEDAFMQTISVTVTTSAEITGTNSARRAVGWTIQIYLSDWFLLINFNDWFFHSIEEFMFSPVTCETVTIISVSSVICLAVMLSINARPAQTQLLAWRLMSRTVGLRYIRYAQDYNVKLRRLRIYYYAISHAINADKKRKLKLKISNA